MKKTLFLLLKPPEGNLPSLLSEYGKESGLLLLEDGILHAVQQDALDALIATGMSLYALQDSVAARGFTEGLPGNVRIVERKEIPQLIMEEYETSVTL